MAAFSGLFKKKVSKSEFAVFLLILQSEWAKSWKCACVDQLGLDEIDSAPYAHTMALFVVTVSVPDIEVRDMVHDSFCIRAGFSAAEKEQFLQYLSDSYAELFPAFSKFMEDARSGPTFATVIKKVLSGNASGKPFSISDILDSIDSDPTVEPLLFSRFNDQLNSTMDAILGLKKKCKVDGL